MMFYLLLAIGGSVSDAKSAILIPEKYPTEQACREAGRISPLGFLCIPAPVKAMCNYSVGAYAIPVECDIRTGK